MYAEAKQRRISEMLKMSWQDLGFGTEEKAQKWTKANNEPFAGKLATQELAFAVMNYPLPH